MIYRFLVSGNIISGSFKALCDHSLMYFPISKLLPYGWSYWFNTLYGFTDHARECRHIHTEIYIALPDSAPQVIKVQINVITMDEPFV